MVEIGSEQYMEAIATGLKSSEDLERDLRFFLRRALLPDGNIRMTEYHSSRLTAEFTSILTAMEAFTRAGAVLSLPQVEACRLKFALDMTDKDVAEALGVSPRTVRSYVQSGLGRLVERMREIVTGE